MTYKVSFDNGQTLVLHGISSHSSAMQGARLIVKTARPDLRKARIVSVKKGGLEDICFRKDTDVVFN